jgi:ketol-acid reductoisomerase
VAKHAGFYPLVEASFYEETVSDLFSEQAVLCSIVPYIIFKATEFLKSKGIPEEIAVYECLHELGFIIDVIKQKGFGGMYESISPVAMAGGLGILNEFKKSFDIDTYMEKIFSKIENKDFLNYLGNVDRKKLIQNIRHDSKSFDKSVAKVSN